MLPSTCGDISVSQSTERKMTMFERFEVDPKGTIQDWLHTGGLDWKVQQRKLYMRCQPSDTHAECEIPYHAIVNATTGRTFQVASKGYKPMQNERMLEDFKEWADAGDLPVEAVGSAKDGAIVWALAKMNDSFTLKGGDAVESFILFGNSHDGSVSYRATSTTVRPVCENTLAMALSARGGERIFAYKHTAQLGSDNRMELKRRMKELIRLHSNAMYRFHETAQKLSETSTKSQDQVRQFILQLVNPDAFGAIVEKTQAVMSAGSVVDSMLAAWESPKVAAAIDDKALGRVGRAILDSIIDSPGSELPSADGTWWGVVNGVTHYVDHVAGRTDDNRLTAAWFGQRSNLKQEAFQLASRYAN